MGFPKRTAAIVVSAAAFVLASIAAVATPAYSQPSATAQPSGHSDYCWACQVEPSLNVTDCTLQ